MAEGEGFEPPVPFQAQRFSRPPVSTAHPSLRGVWGCVRLYFQTWSCWTGFPEVRAAPAAAPPERFQAPIAPPGTKTTARGTVKTFEIKTHHAPVVLQKGVHG